MPKPPSPSLFSAPTAPTSASFLTRASAASIAASQRPNKFINPLLGASTSNIGKPSLLGGA